MINKKTTYLTTDTLKLLEKCFGAQCLTRSQVFKGYKSFSEDREGAEDEPRSGITVETINEIKKLVLSHRRLTC